MKIINLKSNLHLEPEVKNLNGDCCVQLRLALYWPIAMRVERRIKEKIEDKLINI